MSSNQLVCFQQRFTPSASLVRQLRDAHAGPTWLSRSVHRLYGCPLTAEQAAQTLSRALERSLEALMRREGDGYELRLGAPQLTRLLTEIERRLPVLNAQGRLDVARKVLHDLRRELALGRQLFTRSCSILVDDGALYLRSQQAPAEKPAWLKLVNLHGTER